MKRKLALWMHTYCGRACAHLELFRLILVLDILILMWLLKGLIIELGYIGMNVNLYEQNIECNVYEHECNYEWVEMWYWRLISHVLWRENMQEQFRNITWESDGWRGIWWKEILNPDISLNEMVVITLLVVFGIAVWGVIMSLIEWVRYANGCR